MNISINITDASPEEAQRIFDALRGETTTKPASQKAAPKAEAKTASVKKEEKAEETEDEATGGSVPTEDEVTAAAKKFVGDNTREALIEKLGAFDVKNISALGEDQRQAFIDSLS